LIDERFYHLDTCFCPLPDGRVLYYPDAFDRDSLATIAARVPPERRHEVDAADALGFACNAVGTGGTFLTDCAGDALRARLAGWGLEVVVSPLGEFLRAGGAAKCLVLALDHPGSDRRAGHGRVPTPVSERAIEVRGHLLDTRLMSTLLD